MTNLLGAMAKGEGPEPVHDIDIELGPNGGKLWLSDRAEIEAWLDKERKFWRWLDDVKDVHEPELLEPLTFIQSTISTLSRHLEDWPAHRDDFLQELQKYAVEPPHLKPEILHSDNKIAQFAKNLCENTGPEEALSALSWWFGQKPNLDNRVHARGAVALINFLDDSDTGTVQAGRRQPDRTEESYRQVLSRATNTQQDLIAQLANSAQEQEKWLGEQKTVFDRTLEEASAEYQSIVNFAQSAKNAIDEIGSQKSDFDNVFEEAKGQYEIICNLVKTSKEAARHLERQKSNFNDLLVQAEKISNGIRDLFESAKEHKNELSQKKAEFENLLKVAQDQFKEQQKKVDADWTGLKDTYNKELAREAPVQYWRRKRRKHGFMSLVFLAALVVYAWQVFEYVPKFLTANNLDRVEFWQTIDWSVSILFLFAFAVILGLGGIIFWLVLGQLRLGSDADGRVTMINTFLALESGGYTDGKQMDLFMSRLFSSVAGGVHMPASEPPHSDPKSAE